MITMTKDYGKQYVSLKKRLNVLRSTLFDSVLNESTLNFSTYLNDLSKELDMRYSDERYFDDLEEKISAIENLNNF